MKINKMLDICKGFISKHSGTILTVAAVSGVACTAVLSAKAGARANDRINEEFLKQVEDNPDLEDISFKDKVRVAWKEFGWTMVSAAATTVCIVCSDRISKAKIATLTAALEVSKTAIDDYQEKTKEIVGEKKEQKIREETVKDRTEAAYSASDEIKTWYCPISKRHFDASESTVREAILQLNKLYITRGFATINDFYRLIGLDEDRHVDGIGWSEQAYTTYGYNWIDVIFIDKCNKRWGNYKMLQYPNEPTKDCSVIEGNK